jgi:coenzyme PQQ synthesis protein D (PqqD)
VTRVSPTTDAVFAGVPGGGVVLHTGTKRYYSLNETGARIWALLEEHGDAERAIVTIVTEYGITPDAAATAVNDLVAQLTTAGLLHEVPAGS